MTIFYQTILRVIKSYKNMLKKSLTPAKYETRIRGLGIKCIHTKDTDEIRLYKIGLKIIAELEQHATAKSKRIKSVNFYHGEEEFLQHLKKLYSEHTIENDSIINIPQKSSCALVTAIQLIDRAKERMTDEIATQIHQCVRIIAKYGNQEQKRIFNKIISGSQPQHTSLFFRQLQNLIPYLDESQPIA
jgi:hypothetical protein